MSTLSFDYKHKPKQYRAPKNWNELTAIQLIRWAAVAFGDSTEGDKVRAAVCIMYNIEWKIFKKLPDHYIVQAFPNLEYLFKQCQVNKWLLKSFRLGYRRYFGPADKLTNLSAHEFFNYTEVLYQKWQGSRSEQHLNQLCAILYRQKRKTEVFDDIRVPLTDAGVALRSRRFEKVNISLKRAILLNYEGCRYFIIKNHPDIFKPGGNLQRNRTPKDLVLALSNGPFGDYTTTQNANLYKFLEHVSESLAKGGPAK